MANLGLTFSVKDQDTEQRGEYEDLPNGIYQLEIDSSEVVDTGPEERRTGKGLKYSAVVLAPEEVEGRKFFGFINLQNVNEIADRIGRQEFSRLCRAIGLEEDPADSEELHFRSFTAKLGLGKPSKKKNPDGSPMYAARTEIKLFYYPDEGDLPEPAIDADQPTRGAPANDNRPASNASTARTTQNGGAASSDKPKRPWGGK